MRLASRPCWLAECDGLLEGLRLSRRARLESAAAGAGLLPQAASSSTQRVLLGGSRNK